MKVRLKGEIFMSYTPKKKVAAAGIGGAVVTIAVALGLSLSPEVAAAVATIVSFLAGYFKAE
jgi:hypothetical protein